jgi:acetyl-CoA synthetase
MVLAQRLEEYHFYDKEWDSYNELRESFEWNVPEKFNIASYICDRWAEKRGRVAVFGEESNGTESVYTFWRLQKEANKLANYFESIDIKKGDRVGVCLNQRPLTLVAHIACWKIGAVSVPLSLRFGPDAIEHRLGDCEAVACVAEAATINSIRDAELPSLETLLTVGDVELRDSEQDLEAAIADESRYFETLKTNAEDNAMIIYTSGTTGPPKGVVHAHRVLLGQLPSEACSYLHYGTTENTVRWTPVEWSWIGSLNGVIMPTLFYGQPVVAYSSEGFDPHEAYRIMEKYGVTDFGGPTSAVRMLLGVEEPDYDLSDLRLIETGGEAVGESVREGAKDVLGIHAFVETYGQTEACWLIADCETLAEVKPGTIGLPVPGHEVKILDRDTREELGPGEIGEIAVKYEGDPTCFKGYWERPDKTDKKVQNGWLLTEDLGKMDEDGYFEFVGRTDDVILSSGYKIGPEEVEESISSHPAIADAGVIGIPHEERGKVPKAFVVAKHEPDDSLRDELKTYVRERLASYQYPREIEFVDELPRTSTEKVRRRDLRKKEGLLDD